jgi:GT2 family glycosyltransferase
LNVAIAAIVVTYQSGSTIDACLSRLRQAQDVAEIRVIDNGSLDGTLDIVQRHASHDPRVRFVGNPDNPGFAAANNQGVADSHSPWLAFINPDLMVEPDTLAELRSAPKRWATACWALNRWTSMAMPTRRCAAATRIS